MNYKKLWYDLLQKAMEMERFSAISKEDLTALMIETEIVEFRNELTAELWGNLRQNELETGVRYLSKKEEE